MERISGNVRFELKVMSHFDINAEQWMLTKYLMYKTWNKYDQTLEEFYVNILKTTIPVQMISDMIVKGIIEDIDIKSLKSLNDIYDNLYFTEDFNKFYSTELYVLGEELWAAFPLYMSHQPGMKKFPARNITKMFKDVEELYLAYYKAIDGNVDKHREVLTAIKYGVRSGNISFGITEFVISRQWEGLLDLMQSEEKEVVMACKFGNDLWSLFPSNINGFPMKNIVKFGFNNVESFNKFYFNAIEYDEDTHEEVMMLLKNGLDADLINYNIYEFVATKKWDDLRRSLADKSVGVDTVLFQELYEAYPDTEIINGNQTSLKVITSGYSGFKAIAKDYFDAIAREEEVHKQVLRVLRHSKGEGLINMSISNFVKNRLWISFAKKM